MSVFKRKSSKSDESTGRVIFRWVRRVGYVAGAAFVGKQYVAPAIKAAKAEADKRKAQQDATGVSTSEAAVGTPTV